MANTVLKWKKMCMYRNQEKKTVSKNLKFIFTETKQRLCSCSDNSMMI